MGEWGKGRSTNEPKVYQLRIRMSEDDIAFLKYCAEKTGKKKAAIVRDGIRKIYQELKEKE